MKTKILSLLIVLAFFSCKNEKAVDNLETAQPEKIENAFKIILKVIVKKQDDFALYYTEDGTINFFDVKPIWKAVVGNENEQDVIFELPEDVYPTQLRFDLGLKKDQENITIKGVTISYNNKKFEAFGPKFFTYFRADENQCTADITTGVVKAVVKDGVRKGPSIYPQQTVLGPELLKLAN